MLLSSQQQALQNIQDIDSSPADSCLNIARDKKGLCPMLAHNHTQTARVHIVNMSYGLQPHARKERGGGGDHCSRDRHQMDSLMLVCMRVGKERWLGDGHNVR